MLRSWPKTVRQRIPHSRTLRLPEEGNDLVFVQPPQPRASDEYDPDARENREVDSDYKDDDDDDDGSHLFPKMYTASATPKLLLPASFASWSPAIPLGS